MGENAFTVLQNTYTCDQGSMIQTLSKYSLHFLSHFINENI